jgi:hypothetical protein
MKFNTTVLPGVELALPSLSPPAPNGGVAATAVVAAALLL